MAEFKLGRIRFVWKNDWATSTVYYKDDVIAYGGRIYICVIGHTAAADFFTDLDITPSKWNLISDGQTWKGDWAPQERYNPNDIVRYGPRLYICQEVHTSAEDSTTGLEADLDKWQVFADGLEFKGDWTVSTDYRVNDTVKYGGATYVCTDDHTSAATTADGLEANSSSWTLMNQGFDWKQEWVAGTRYKVNDVVKFGGTLWIATQYHTASGTFGLDSANWEKFVEGIQFEDRWIPTAFYQPGDIVRYGGNQYIAKTDNNAVKPPSSTADWDLFSSGFRFLGDWNDDSTNEVYEPGDVVRLGGYTYRCTVEHSNQQPPNTDYWERMNSGFEWKGEWLDDREYYEGDVVRYGDNSYVCIQGHISEGDDYSSLSSGAEGSRPDLADSGQYWSVMAIGTETSVLNTKGDMVYYSGTAPTRLPIGQDGQILTVSKDGIPKWEFLGNANDVYYVAEHGQDLPSPIYGKNWDRPFKSIRYATEQIDRGAKVPQARALLELNRRFIQREIVEWTKFQCTNGNAPFTVNFDFDTGKCERDMGFLIDAFVWDMTHGGNERSREAALAYINAPATSDYQNQKAETVASINYGLTVIEKVLAQEAPDTIYQVENGDNSTAIVEQYFISAYGNQATAEYEGTISGTSTGAADSSPAGSSGGNNAYGGGY